MATNNYETQIYSINCSFHKQIFITTTVTNNPSKVTEWITSITTSNVEGTLVFGLDVEWRPTFASGHINPIATLQLCHKDKCLIYQIIHSPQIPDSLKNLLSTHTFVGICVKLVLQELYKDYGIGKDAYSVDLRDLAEYRYGKREMQGYKLKELFKFVFGVGEVSWGKASVLWDSERLMVDQVKHACFETFLGYEIGARLRADDLECYVPVDRVFVGVN